MIGQMIGATMPNRPARLLPLLLVAACAVQVVMLAEITQLRARIVQLEAGVEFWEYGQGACSPPAGALRLPYLPQGFVGYSRPRQPATGAQAI